MNKDFTQQAKDMELKKGRRRIWKRVVGVLGCIVVFCTTYALILPAITLGQKPQCGLEEHVHTDACYTEVSEKTCICTPESLGIHQHTADCYDAEGNLICGYADFVIHVHDENCYNDAGELICPLPEIRPHTHTDECYKIEKTLICEQPEAEAHTHDESCYGPVRGNLICTEEERPGHTHGPECYETQRVLVCTEDHEHTDACYEDQQVLICTVPEDPGHTHTDDCYEINEGLICGMEEGPGHTHTDECYREEKVLVCDKPEIIPHIHDESCYDAEGNLICGMIEIREHVHTPECFAISTSRTLSCGKEEHLHNEDCFLPEEQQTLTVESGGASISVSGMLPVGAEISAVPVETSIENTEVVMAFDISILMPDGSTFEPPQGTLNVVITAPEISGADCGVYYVPEEGVPEAVEATAAEGSLSFNTPHFSTYAVTRSVPPQETVLEEGPVCDEAGNPVEGINYQYVQKLDGTRVLRAIGAGAIPNYNSYNKSTFNKFASKTDRIEIYDGITEIGENAFYYSSASEIVFYGETLRRIGPSSFRHTNVRNLNLPDSVKILESHCFANCQNLREINLGKVEEIKGSPFFFGGNNGVLRLPASLNSITHTMQSLAQGNFTAFEVDPANPKYMSEDGVLYEKLADGNRKLIAYPGLKEGIYTFPPDVTEIGKCAFTETRGIVSITIPPTVKHFDDEAFRFSGLEEIIVQDGVTTDDNYAFFSGSFKLRRVRLPDNFCTEMSSTFYACYSLESVRIIPSATSQANACWQNYDLREMVFDAEAMPFVDQAFSTHTSTLNLVIGGHVNSLPESFKLNAVEARQGKIVFVPDNEMKISPGAFAGTGGAYEELNGNVYVDSQGLIYTYDESTHTAELFTVPEEMAYVDHESGDVSYIPITKVNIPETISPLEGVSCTVSSVRKDAIKYNQFIDSLTVDKPENIHLQSYALANCPNLMNINGETEIEKAEALFASAGSNVLYNTGLKGAPGPDSFRQDMDGSQNQIVGSENQPKLIIDVEAPGWTDKNPELPGVGGYNLLTGQTLNITASVGNTAGVENFVYRIYMQATSSDCAFGIKPGTDTLEGQAFTVYETDDSNTLCLEFTPNIGTAASIPIKPLYPSPQSSGGGLSVWGIILPKEQSDGEGSTRPVVRNENGCVQASWITEPDPFTLSKSGKSAPTQLKSYKNEDGSITIRPSGYISWTVSFNRLLDSAYDFGKDYAKSVDFEDKITLPQEFIWDQDFVNAVKNRTLGIRGGDIWLDDQRVFSLNKPDSLEMNSIRVRWDDESQSPVLCWRWQNIRDRSEINAMKLNLSLCPRALRLKDGVLFGSDKTVEINNSVNATVHYMHSSDKKLSAQAVNYLGGNPGRLGITKTATEAEYFGEAVNFKVSVYNEGSMPWIGKEGFVYELVDDMGWLGYVSPENLQKMFIEAEEANMPLRVEISKGLAGPAETVTAADGVSTAIRHAANSDIGGVVNLLKITKEPGENIYYAEHGGNKYQGSSVAEALQSAGFAGRRGNYDFIWLLGEGSKAVLQTGEKRDFNIYANAKDTFGLLPDDSPHQYIHSNRESFDNYANVSERPIDGGAGTKLVGTNARTAVRREAIINKAVYSGDTDLSAGPTGKNGDILEYSLVFDHFGSCEYDNLPFVDTCVGSQLLLAPAADNPGLSNMGLEIVTEKDGTEYYKLGPGSYSDVRIGQSESGDLLTAASVEVSVLPENKGISSTLKWYFSHLPGGDYRKEISYKSVVDTSSTGSASWTLGNTVWVNDRQEDRIFASVWGEGTLLGFKKELLTSKGDTPAQDIVDADGYSVIGRGDSVTYRLRLSNSAGFEYILNGRDIADALPQTFGAFSWTKDSNIRLSYVSSESGVEITGIENWSIGPAPDGLSDDPDRQFVVWPDTTQIKFEKDASVCLYFTLDFPQEKDSWGGYAAQACGTLLDNTLYIHRFPSSVYHDLKEVGKAALTKSVVSTSWSDNYNLYRIISGSSRQYYNNRDSEERGVAYCVTLYNGGYNRLYLSEIHDILPRGFHFRNLTNSLTNPAVISGEVKAENYLTELPPSAIPVSAVISADVGKAGPDGSAPLSFSISEGYGPSSVKFDDKQKMYYLDSNEALSFGYLVSVDIAENTDEIAVNSVAMKYTDNLKAGVEPVEGFSVRAKNPGNKCIDDNNGSFSVISAQQASAMGFPAKEGQWLFSEVALRRGGVIPGVTKLTESYTTRIEGQENSETTLPYENYAPQNSELNWRIRYSNGGTSALTDYIISDTLPKPYVPTGELRAELRSADGDLLIKQSYFKINSIYKNAEGREFVNVTILEENCSEKWSSFDIEVGGDGINTHPVFQSKIYKTNILFSRDAKGNLKLSMHIANPAMSITEHGGTLDIFISGVNPTRDYVNAVFTNNASLKPVKQRFTSVNAGSGVKDENGELSYVVSSAPVNVAFGHATSSYKAVEEKSNPDNRADSTDFSRNTIILSRPDSLFRYSLSVKNSTEKPMTKLVLIDNLPHAGDTSPFDTSSPRDSEFEVSLPDQPNFELKVKLSDGSERVIDPALYSIEYSTSVDFGGTQTPDWKGEASGKWSASAADARSIRVIVNDADGSLIPPASIVVLSFDACASGGAQPGAVAWNNFGYHYGLKGIINELEAMPLNVGVKIPAVPVLEKRLCDIEGNTLKADADTEFSFILSDGSKEKELKLKVLAGESTARLVLDSKIMGADWNWQRDTDYSIREIGLEKHPEWKFHSWSGGTSEKNGVLSFRFDPGTPITISCLNRQELWKLCVNKVDMGDENIKLEGAVFGLYSSHIEDAMSDEDYNALGFKPGKTLKADDKLWYLKDVKSSSPVIWDGLNRESYYVAELKAPDGYNIKPEPILVSRHGAEVSINVTNAKGFALPKTGGSGTLLYTAGGLILMSSALMFMIRKKYRGKRRADD